MTTAGEVFRYIDTFAPFRTALSFDNAGLLVGSGEAPVRRALLALDITADVVEEARKRDCQLIVSHHPVIFQPVRRLSAESIPYRLAQAGITAICAHTNLDLSPQGVNTALARALALTEIQTLRWHTPDCGGEPLAYALYGALKESYTPREFARYVKHALACEGVRWLPGKKPVKTVALCSGAGGDMVYEAAEQGIDAFVTGEIKHHELLAAGEAGLTVVDAGHFKTEHVVLSPLARMLQKRFADEDFLLSASGTDGVHYL